MKITAPEPAKCAVCLYVTAQSVRLGLSGQLATGPADTYVAVHAGGVELLTPFHATIEDLAPRLAAVA